MAARYLKAETSNLFSSETFLFEKASTERENVARENQELYQVRAAKKKLD
ncbi:MAG: hypothetical protein WCO26_18035 [Deltaproteobacteria bacterium]